MRKVEEIERQIEQLSREDYAKLRDWFLEQDAKAWDAQIETDVSAGRLDKLGEAARRAHAQGKTTKL